MNVNKFDIEIFKNAMRMAKFIQQRIKTKSPNIYYLFKNNNYKNLIK